MGESYGRYQLIDDAILMPYIDACNIACGFHAGDPSIMENTIGNALNAGIEIGAHPSYPDRNGFGRRYMDINEIDLTAMIKYQVCAIAGMIQSRGGSLHHVKAHGALYNRAASHHPEARAVARAVSDISNKIILYAPFNSVQSEVAKEFGLTVHHEAFIDRRYNNDGTLVSRKLENAVISNPEIAWTQTLRIFERSEVESIQGPVFQIAADTFCIHGDNPSALSILQKIQLEKNR